MILGIGVAVLLEYFDTSFRNVADVETRLKLPVLGVIPFSREPQEDIASDPAESEPYRVLHTNLNLTLKPGHAASFVIFLRRPGEGKSTTLHHLARLMGSAGERVLPDADLDFVHILSRAGRAHARQGPAARQAGIGCRSSRRRFIRGSGFHPPRAAAEAVDLRSAWIHGGPGCARVDLPTRWLRYDKIVFRFASIIECKRRQRAGQHRRRRRAAHPAPAEIRRA